MANITKRVNKRAAQHLGGESAEVVLLCEMKGGLGVGAVGTVVARRTTERVIQDRTADRLAEEGGIALTFPASTCALVLTPTRFLALPSNGITFRPPALSVDRAGVRAEVIGVRGVGRRMALRFADGSRVEVDVQLGQPTKQFVAALDPDVGASPFVN